MARDNKPSDARFAELSRKILALLSGDRSDEELITAIVLTVQRETGFEAVGVRLLDGLDYPYYFTRGFDQDFVEKEMYLCAHGTEGELIRDGRGEVQLECMCGNVIAGKTDPSYPFFTEGGSFWTNSTTDLLATTSKEQRQAKTRNHCNTAGYESVGLIPIKADGTTYGLLQLNDSRRDMFDIHVVELLEGIASSIGMLFSMKHDRDKVRGGDDVMRLLARRTLALEQIIAEMKGNGKSGAGRTQLIEKFDQTLEDLDAVTGVLPVCSRCHRIKTSEGTWEHLDGYVGHSINAAFTRTFCPECYEPYMRELDELPIA
ncbi:MAG: GAF domain-containing protein [Planctomycetota bacterium]|jgi:hypothetical protein